MDYQIEINDYIGTWGYSKGYVRSLLKSYKGKPVNVRISSLGGEIVHGLDIRQQFIDHGQVTAYLYGMVASAATVVAMGAKRVLISRHAMFLIHQVSNWVDEWGQMNADQIQQLIDQLQENQADLKTIDLVIAKIYADRTGKSIEEMHQLMKRGAWMTAEDAVKLGFVDGYVEKRDDKKQTVKNIANVLDRLQLPELPEGFVTDEEQAENEGAERSLLGKLANSIKGVFKDENKSSNTEINNQTVMRDDFVSVNQVLGVEGLECSEDGMVTLTVDQVQALNDRLGSLESNAATMQQTIDTQTSQIEALQKGDGGATSQVREKSKKAAQRLSVQAMYNEVKDFI